MSPLRLTLEDDSKPGSRHCGGCTLCCKLLPMKKNADAHAEARKLLGHPKTLPAFDKPAGARCPHQSHHKGCTVYAVRPLACRLWNCRWLVNNDTAELRRPDRSRYVIDIMPDYVELVDNETGKKTAVEVVQIWVDPHHRDAWRDPALLAYIERRGKKGIAAIIRWSNRDALTVFPPTMAQDGQWHEYDHGTLRPEHTAQQRFDGIARARD